MITKAPSRNRSQVAAAGAGSGPPSAAGAGAAPAAPASAAPAPPPPPRADHGVAGLSRARRGRADRLVPFRASPARVGAASSGLLLLGRAVLLDRLLGRVRFPGDGRRGLARRGPLLRPGRRSGAPSASGSRPISGLGVGRVLRPSAGFRPGAAPPRCGSARVPRPVSAPPPRALVRRRRRGRRLLARRARRRSLARRSLGAIAARERLRSPRLRGGVARRGSRPLILASRGSAGTKSGRR